MSTSILVILPVSLFVTLVLAPAVRLVAVRLSLYSREQARPKPDTTYDKVPLLGGVAIAAGIIAGVFSGGATSVEVLPLIVCALAMGALGLTRDLWPLRPATLLAGQFVAAFLVVAMLSPVRLAGAPVVDTLIASGWIVALGSAMASLERFPKWSLAVGVVAALAPLAAGIGQASITLQFALLAAAASVAALLIYTLVVLPLASGCAGALPLGGWLAVAALMAPPSAEVGQMVATGIPIALVLAVIAIRSTSPLSPPGGKGIWNLFANRVHEVWIDLTLGASLYYTAFSLRFDEPQFSEFLPYFTKSLPIVLGSQVAALWAVGKYHRVRFVPGMTEAAAIVKGVAFGVAAGILLLVYEYRFVGFSRWVFVLHGAFLSIVLIGYPMVVGGASGALRARRGLRKVLIYGAGRAGTLLLREVLQNDELNMTPVGFIDDDLAKRRLKLDGFPVLGTVHDLPAVLVRQPVSDVLVSTKEISPERLATLMGACREHGVRVIRMRLLLEDLESPSAPADARDDAASRARAAQGGRMS